MSGQDVLLIVAFVAGTITGACAIFGLLLWISARAMFEEKESRELVKRGRSDADSDS